MKTFRIVPEIEYFDTFKEFSDTYKFGDGDVLVTNRWLYDPYVKPLGLNIPVIFQEEYGMGEPSDEMIDAIVCDINKNNYKRIIAYGGGTIVDICKVLALEMPEKSIDLFMGNTAAVKKRKLFVVPTTCGTGSEVTNVAVAELKSLSIKKGLASEQTYADKAILIPESLSGLPDYVFATSSIDALIHAAESFLSPNASEFSEMYSIKAIQMILDGYMKIVCRGGNCAENREDLLKNFCIASNYAGIAFGNAGCGAVHALSYSIGGAFHVPHGEANYQFFIEVFRTYMQKKPDGKIFRLNKICAEVLKCNVQNIYTVLEELLDKIIARKPLCKYGMLEEQIGEFTKSTIENQQRLLNNNYVFLSEEDIKNIFTKLYI